MLQADKTAMDGVYTAINFIPVLTLVAVTYAAGAFSQRVKAMEAKQKDSDREINRVRRRVHHIANVMAAKGIEPPAPEEDDESSD